MIQEKMLEALLLSHILNNYFPSRNKYTIRFNEKEHDYNKMYKRYKVLIDEFLEPYVINKNSKE